MEVITGVERRRRWRPEQKLRILAELDEPRATVAEIARRHEVSRGLLWKSSFALSLMSTKGSASNSLLETDPARLPTALEDGPRRRACETGHGDFVNGLPN